MQTEAANSANSHTLTTPRGDPIILAPIVRVVAASQGSRVGSSRALAALGGIGASGRWPVNWYNVSGMAPQHGAGLRIFDKRGVPP